MNRSRAWLIAAVLVSASLALCVVLLVHFPDAATRTIGLEQRGEELARIACAACHVAPVPGDLPRGEWEYTLPQMAWLLGQGLDFPAEGPGPHDGFAAYEIEHLRGKRLSFADKNLIPSRPTVTEDDWRAIYVYYVDRAPERLTPPVPSGLSDKLDFFRVMPTDYAVRRALTTMAKIEEPTHELWIGDSAWCDSGCPRSLTVLDAHGKSKFSIELDRDPIDVHLDEHGFVLSEIGAFFPYHIDTNTPADILRFDRAGGQFERTRLFADLPRIANTNVTDLDRDGDADIVVCAHGWGMVTIGHVSWLENRAPEPYREHVLMHQPGCVRTDVVDVDRDGRQDLLVLTAGAREGLYLLRGSGPASFTTETLFERHPAFGFTHMQLADFNGDGFIDVVTVNGDDIDGHPDKLLRPYQGVRIFLNHDGRSFEEAFFYHVRGACMASAKDFDGDGDVDLAVVATFPDLSVERPVSFVFLRNDGELRFAPFTHAATYGGRWLTLDGGDLDGDADADLVLGGFYSPLGLAMYDPRVSRRLERMQESGPPILVLENTTRP